MKKLVFTFLIVFGCLLAANSKADTISMTVATDTYMGTPSSSYLTGQLIHLGPNSTLSNYLLYGQTNTSILNVYDTSKNIVASTSNASTSGNPDNGFITYTFGSSPVLPEGYYYFAESYSGSSMNRYGTGGNHYVNGGIIYPYYPTSTSISTSSVDNGYDIYFILNGANLNSWACSHWTDFANCIWEGNPVYPTGSYGTGNCTWFGDPNGEGFCKDVASAQGIHFGTDETTLFSETPVECVANEFPSSNATMTIPVSMNFYNPPVCTGELQVCQPENITYNDITINFYNSYNNATSFVLISSVAPGKGKSYAGNLIIPSGTYRVEYNATGTNTLGMTFPFTAPNCLTTVSTTTISTSTEMNYWGTINYLECTNAYDNCIASSTSFIERATCGIQGAFWSLFCPNPLALAKAKAITSETQKRFPITLVKVFTSAFSSYATSDLATSSATTTYVQADISGFYALGNIGFFADFRSILTALGFIMIGIFALRFTFEHFFTSK